MNRAKKVYQYDLEGNFIKEWNSQKEVSTFYDFSPGILNRLLNSQSGTVKGFQYRRYNTKNIGRSKRKSIDKVYQGICNLKLLREQKGLTQKAVADSLEMTPSYYNVIEKNKSKLTLSVVFKILKYYNITFEELFNIKIKRPRKNLKPGIRKMKRIR